MYPGDLVLTPNWTWHDHANDTDDPIIWLDGLDIPLVHMLEAVYYEPLPGGRAACHGTHRFVAEPLRRGHAAPHVGDQQRRAFALDALPVAADLANAAAAGSRSPMAAHSTASSWNTPTPTPAARSCRPSPATYRCCDQVRPPKPTGTLPAPSTTWSRAKAALWSVARQSNGRIRTSSACPAGTTTRHANASDTEPAVLFSFTEAPVLQAFEPAARTGPPQRAPVRNRTGPREWK